MFSFCWRGDTSFVLLNLWSVFNLFTVFAMHGISTLGFLFMSTNAGDSELAFGVVLRASNAKYGSSEQCLTFFNVFFTACIVLSTSLLLWGCSGLDVIYLKFCILANSQNSLAVYCDPLSLFLMVCRILRSLHFHDDFFTGEVLKLANFKVFRHVIYKNKVVLIKTMKQIIRCHFFPWLFRDNVLQ